MCALLISHVRRGRDQVLATVLCGGVLSPRPALISGVFVQWAGAWSPFP
jgi:hypothetical protein